MSFKAKVDDDTGLVFQKVDNYVEECLKKSYKAGTVVSGLMTDFGNGKAYTEDFLDFILKNYGNVRGKKILEIGCGTGYLLYRLQELGAETIGVEPGTLHKSEQQKYNVDVINDFLSLVKKYLEDSGNIVLAVPDCEEYITFGDISMFFHEHYSCFTQNTLNSFLEKHFTVTGAKKAGYGGVIYTLAENSYPQIKYRHW